MNQRNEVLCFEPVRGHSRFGLWGVGQTPWAFARRGQPASLFSGYAEFPQERGNRASPLALFEAIAAQLSPNPLVQALEFEPTGRIAVVGNPPHQEQIEFDNHLRQANAPVPTGDLPDFLLGAWNALGSDPKFSV